MYIDILVCNLIRLPTYMKIGFKVNQKEDYITLMNNILTIDFIIVSGRSDLHLRKEIQNIFDSLSTVNTQYSLSPPLIYFIQLVFMYSHSPGEVSECLFFSLSFLLYFSLAQSSHTYISLSFNSIPNNFDVEMVECKFGWPSCSWMFCVDNSASSILGFCL